jgi:hypothetical protein
MDDQEFELIVPLMYNDMENRENQKLRIKGDKYEQTRKINHLPGKSSWG